MNIYPVPFRFIATALLSGILLLVGIMNLRDRALWTEPADGVFWTEDHGRLTAEEIKPDSPAGRANILPGDQLQSINNGSRSITLQLEAKGVLTPSDGFRTVLAFLHLSIGLFVLFKAGRSALSYHFYFICLAAFVLYLYSYTTRLNALDLWVYSFSVLAVLLLPALLVHFCLRFPSESPVKIHPLPIYIPALFLITLQVLWLTGHLASIGLPRT
ncbi:MAG: hypothetical protein P8Y80_11360, partial [Acidobacteriota bacterium]